MRSDIAIGIVSYERPLITQRCIDSIRTATRVPYHIYLADNGSPSQATKDYLDIWEKQKDMTVIRLEGNGGAAAGRNAILDKILGEHDIIAVLDNDCVVLHGWDTAAVQALTSDCDVVAPKLLSADLKTVERGPTRPWPGGWLVHPEYIGRGEDRYSPNVTRRQSLEIFPGTAIFRTELFQRIGCYDPRIWVADDYDIAFRAAAAGVRVRYEPECEIVHDHGFEPEYEKIRFDPEKSLISHVVMWEKHRKLLLSPSSLRLFRYLIKNKVPMWTVKAQGIMSFALKVRRRAISEYYCRRYGEVWASGEEGARITETIISGKIVDIERSW